MNKKAADVCPPILRLPAEVLQQIAAYLRPDSAAEVPAFRLPIYEQPRLQRSFSDPPEAARSPDHLPRGSIWKAYRHFRASCKQIYGAIPLHDIHVRVSTVEDLEHVFKAPPQVIESISYVRFNLPWLSGSLAPVSCILVGSRLPPIPITTDGERLISDCPLDDALSLLRRILDCLALLNKVQRIAFSTLPLAGEHHDTVCASIRLAIRQLSWNEDLLLDRLTGYEIPNAEFQACEYCSAAITGLFERLLGQCHIVKLEAIPKPADTRGSLSFGVAETLYLKTDSRDAGDSALLDALNLGSVFPNVRKLVLHSCHHFIDIDILRDTDGRLGLHSRKDLTFDDLMHRLKLWPQVEELDIHLKIRCPFKRWIQDWHSTRPHHHRAVWSSAIEDDIAEFVLTYASELCDRWDPVEEQLALVSALAETLPKLRKVWLWAKVPLPEENDDCNLRYPVCRRWNILSAFRIPWYIHRRESDIVYARGRVNGSTELQSPRLEANCKDIINGVLFKGRIPLECQEMKEMFVPLDDPHPQLCFPS